MLWRGLVIEGDTPDDIGPEEMISSCTWLWARSGSSMKSSDQTAQRTEGTKVLLRLVCQSRRTCQLAWRGVELRSSVTRHMSPVR
jgi:hypothetical protein